MYGGRSVFDTFARDMAVHGGPWKSYIAGNDIGHCAFLMYLDDWGKEKVSTSSDPT